MKGLLSVVKATLVLIVSIVGLIFALVSMVVGRVVLPKQTYSRFAQAVQERFLLLFTLFIEAPSNRKVLFSGDRVPDNESALVVPNHAAAHGDWAPLYCLAARSRGLGSIKTVSKDILKFIPFFGWGMYLMEWPFLKRNWAADKAYLDNALAKFSKSGLPLLLWLFCEGTRWTPKKHAAAVEFAKSRQMYEPEHTLVPKATGFIALAKGLRGTVTHLHDVTLAYTGYPINKKAKGPGPAQVFAPVTQPKTPCTFHIHVRRIPMSEVPLDDDKQLKQFLFDMFQRKDELLKTFYQTGSFGEGVKEIELDLDARTRPTVIGFGAVVALLSVASYLFLL